MEIVPMSMSLPGTGDSHTVGLPFNRRNVEEWSRLDSITGIMEKAKIETDRWSASNSAGSHNFAKVVDSRERNRPDGSLQQRQRKQLEMFETTIPGGSMQVIRTRTVTTSSSQSSVAFGKLELPVNQLDLSTQKTKGCVGRSGSISGRRPPSRPKSLGNSTSSALCDDQTQARLPGSHAEGSVSASTVKTNLDRQKSCSNEYVHEEAEQDTALSRFSKLRSSLQFPKTSEATLPDWTHGKSLKERAAEIENLLRRTSSLSFETKKEISPAKGIIHVSNPVEKPKEEPVSCASSAEAEADMIRVKDFVSGMEARLANDAPTTTRNSASAEWAQRRKTYGFESISNDDTAWTRKSPLPGRQPVRSSSHRNPWISQLRGTKLVDRDWYNGTPDQDFVNEDVTPDSSKAKDEKLVENGQKKQKKVEFCKTEVHFAAEPGRFHIVETDGKPASVCSRRRNSARASPGLPQVKFGDTLVEKTMLTTSNAEKIDWLGKKIESELKELSEMVVEPLPVKRQEPRLNNNRVLPNLDEEQSNETSAPIWKSTVVLQNKKSYSSDGEGELFIRLRNLKKTKNETCLSVEMKRSSLPVNIPATTDEMPTLSVAERIKQVEQFRNNYATKIDFRSGEMTVLQNGMTKNERPEREQAAATVPAAAAAAQESDPKTFSNPSVKRFSTVDPPNKTTTRISINIPCNNKPEASRKLSAVPVQPSETYKKPSSSNEACDKPASASLVMKTIQNWKVKPAVREMVHTFDAMAQRPLLKRQQRRKTMPINFKEYTHDDLEEELRNFTEDLDKDFRDIYEQEIGSFKGSCKDLKKKFEQVVDSADGQSRLSLDKSKTWNSVSKCGFKKPLRVHSNNIRWKSLDNKDDSDVLADEEVESIMSTGHSGHDASDSDTVINGFEKLLSFERTRLRFKRLEQRSNARKQGAKIHTTNTVIKPDYESRADTRAQVGSITLRYEDDPTFSRPSNRWCWEKASNSSSNVSDCKLSQQGSNSSLEAVSRVRQAQSIIRRSFRSSAEAPHRQVNGNGLTDGNHLSSTSDEDSVTRKTGGRGLSTISEDRKVIHAGAKSVSSRATRLLQRASTREAALAHHRSSSEDMAATVQEPAKKKVVRRQRTTPAPLKADKEPLETKQCSRLRSNTNEKEAVRERVKTIVSSTKNVGSVNNKPSSRSCQLTPKQLQSTKPSQRRQLLTKADTMAVRSVGRCETSTACIPTHRTHHHSLSRTTGKVSMRKVEAARVGQAV